jgi:hypothetical protein
MNKKTTTILKEANDIIVNASGTDISLEIKRSAKQKARSLYKKLEKVNPKVYKILLSDEILEK